MFVQNGDIFLWKKKWSPLNFCADCRLRSSCALAFGGLGTKLTQTFPNLFSTVCIITICYIWSRNCNVAFFVPRYKAVASWAHRSNKGLSARKRVEVLSTFQTKAKNFFFKKTLNKKYCDVQLNKAHLFCCINFLPW